MSVIRKPDGSKDEMTEAGAPNPALMAAAEDLIKAVHAKDAAAVCSALEAAYMECDSGDMGEGEADQPEELGE